MNAPDEKSTAPLNDAVGEVARRLKSPPLLLGYGAILVIAIVAMTVGAEFAAVAWAIVALALISLVAWAVFEVIKTRHERQGDSVKFKSEAVGEKGKVTGIEATDGTGESPVNVNIDVGRVDGEVKGIVIGKRDKDDQ